MNRNKLIYNIVGFIFLVACQEPAPKNQYVQDYMIRVGEFVGENFSTISDSLLVQESVLLRQKVDIFGDTVPEWVTKKYKIKNTIEIKPKDTYRISSYGVCNDTILMFLEYNVFQNAIKKSKGSIGSYYMGTWDDNNYIFVIGNISTNEIYHCYDEKTVLDAKTRTLWDTTPEKKCQSILWYSMEGVPRNTFTKREEKAIEALKKVENEYQKFINRNTITPDTGKIKFNLQTCEALDKVIRTRTFRCIGEKSKRYREVMGK